MNEENKEENESKLLKENCEETDSGPKDREKLLGEKQISELSDMASDITKDKVDSFLIPSEREDEEIHDNVTNISPSPLRSDLSRDSPIEGPEKTSNEVVKSEKIDKESAEAPVAVKIDSVMSEISSLKHQVDQLHEEFERKIRYDQHKEKIIDDLHRENQEYKSDVLKGYIKPIIMNIVHVIDDIRKMTGYYKDRELSQEDAIKVLKLLESIPSDLEELLFRQDVESFTCEESSFDPKRQRAIKTIETTDESMHRIVAESLRPGYEWEGKVIRPEIVAVYVFKSNITEKERSESDE